LSEGTEGYLASVRELRSAQRFVPPTQWVPDRFGDRDAAAEAIGQLIAAEDVMDDLDGGPTEPGESLRERLLRLVRARAASDGCARCQSRRESRRDPGARDVTRDEESR
jgi:hypothetical protein